MALPVFADGATRDLPDCYHSDVTFTVSIAIDAPVGTVVVALADSPPAGWTQIGTISDDGTYDAVHHEVRWVFFDAESRTVTYDVTPPGDATGEQCFDGTVSFDGGPAETIEADACIDCCEGIPTLSEWGMVAMTLLVLAAGTLVLAHRRRVLRGAG